MRKNIKEKLDLYIKLSKARTECKWDYDRACEYKQVKSIKRCIKISSIIEKKQNQIMNSIIKSYKVESFWNLPKEIKEYISSSENKIRYDRFNDYERDLTNLGIKLPK